MLFFLIHFLYASNLQAQTTSSTIVSNQQAPASQSLLKIDLQAVNYLSDSIYDQSQQKKAQIELDLKDEGFSSNALFFSDLHILAGTFSLPKSFYFSVPEAYIGWGKSDKSFLVLGRFISSYSLIDEIYHLGLFNSYFTNDFIDFKVQGMPGLHWQYFNQNIGFRLAWTPYFFPNQGPQVREEKGSLVSSNRWAQRPPRQFQFADENHEIIYAIRDFKLNEIIENPGYLFSLFWGESQNQPIMRFSYANHPLNDIPLSRETYGAASDFKGYVNLSPIVTYHEVYSVDLNFVVKSSSFHISYLEDFVKNKTARDSDTLQNLSQLKVMGLSSIFQIENFLNRPWALKLALAEIKGGEIKDLSADGKESIFVFSSQRTQFKSPITFGLSTELISVFAKPVLADISWTYDRTYKGSLLSSELKYQTFSKINLKFGFDFLGVEQSLPDDVASNYLDQNQANDRIYGGLQYEF